MTTRRAVIYARVSYDDRDTDGRNLAGQLAMGRDYCGQNSYPIVGEMPEDARGASGAEIDLPTLNRVRAMARAREFDVLVVRELDRLSRNLAKQLIVEEELKRCGVSIEYVLGEYPDTPEGNLMKHVKASVAEYEREKINERMTRGRRQAAAAGSVMVFQRAPYGYRVAVNTDERGKHLFGLVIEPAEADVVRLIFALYVNGAPAGPAPGPGRGEHGTGGAGPLTINAVARRLTELGIPTAGDTQAVYGRTKKLAYGHWNPSAVANILKNETYCGTWHYGKRVWRNHKPVARGENLIVVDVPVIIDPADFERAAELRARNRRNYTRERKHDYLLGGRLKCKCGYALCGTPVHVHGKLYLYYRCAGNQSREVRTPCRMGKYPAPAIDAKVWEWVSRYLEHPEILLETLRACQTQAEAATGPLREQLAVTDDLMAKRKDELKRANTAYEAGVYTLDELAASKARLGPALAQLQAERDKTARQMAAQRISDERIARIMAFADGQREKVAIAARSFAVRRALAEELELSAVLEKVNGEARIHATCLLGEEDLSVATKATSG